MSLDIYLYIDVDVGADEPRRIELYGANVTHNLNKMAGEAGLYEVLWRPDEHGYKIAVDMIDVIEKGLKLLKEWPDKFKKFNPENGWGNYEEFVSWVEDYLNACKKNPKAYVIVSG